MTSQDKGEGEGRALDSWDVNDTLDWSMAVCYQSVKMIQEEQFHMVQFSRATEMIVLLSLW